MSDHPILLPARSEMPGDIMDRALDKLRTIHLALSPENTGWLADGNLLSVWATLDEAIRDLEPVRNRFQVPHLEAAPHDPIIDAIAAYRAGSEAFRASDRDDEEFCQQTYGEPQAVIVKGAFVPTTGVGAAAALELAMSMLPTDDLSEALLTSALAYLQGRAA